MSTLITYWQSEASRILQAQAEARARLATLRQEAFMEAFTAVDGHFRTIFAELSDNG